MPSCRILHCILYVLFLGKKCWNTTEASLVDGNISSCVEPTASLYSDWQIIFTAAKASCLNNGKVSIKLYFENVVNCGALKRMVFENCGSNQGLRSCRVLTPSATGIWCEVECKCEGEGCNVGLIQAAGLNVIPGMKICEIF